MKNIEELVFGTARKIKGKIDCAIDTVCADIDAAKKASGGKASTLEVLFLDDGFRALEAHRAAHILYNRGWQRLAEVFSRATMYSTGVDIHPSAKMEKGVAIRIMPSVTIEKDDVITSGNCVLSCGKTVTEQINVGNENIDEEFSYDDSDEL